MKTSFTKKFIGYVMLLGALVGLTSSANAAQFVTNFTVGTTTSFLLVSNSVGSTSNISRISQIQVLASTNLVLLDILDSNTNNTNYTFSGYTNTISYATNITTTNISPLNGYTNFTTNIGIFTTNNAVAAGTNALPYTSYPAQANTLATYPVNLIMTKGVVVRVNTNATLIITYRAAVN